MVAHAWSEKPSFLAAERHQDVLHRNGYGSENRVNILKSKDRQKLETNVVVELNGKPDKVRTGAEFIPRILLHRVVGGRKKARNRFGELRRSDARRKAYID